MVSKIETKPSEIYGGTEIAGKHRVSCPPLCLQRRWTWQAIAMRWVGSHEYVIFVNIRNHAIAASCRHDCDTCLVIWHFADLVLSSTKKQSVLGLQYNLECFITSTRLREFVDLHGTSSPESLELGISAPHAKRTTPAPTKGDTGLAPNGSKGVCNITAMIPMILLMAEILHHLPGM